MSRLKNIYKNEIVPKLMKERNYNIMAVPKIIKIVLSMGVGEAVNDKKLLTNAANDLSLISGQHPLLTVARKSISGFKLREGWYIGCKTTLRNNRMYEFLDRLISIVLPRIRDFGGLKSNSFDGNGNYSFGITEQIIFPEIIYDKIDKIRGLNVTIVTSSKNNEESLLLLKEFKFPFR